MNDFSILILNFVMLIPFFLVFILEAFLSLRKNIIIAAIIPFLSLIYGFRHIIGFVILLSRGHFASDSTFPTIAFVILTSIFIICRLMVRHKNLNKIKSDIKTMEIKDLDE